MDRVEASWELDKLLEALSRYCGPKHKLTCKLYWDHCDGREDVAIRMVRRGSLRIVAETTISDEMLMDVASPDFDKRLTRELTWNGFQIETEAEYTARIERVTAERKRRHAEQVKANNRRISERRRERRERRHHHYLNRIVSSFECQVCKAPMNAQRSSKCYCSAKCRQYAQRHWASEDRTSLDRKKQQRAN